MENKKYVIINTEAIEARIEELKKDYNQKAEINDNQWCSIIAGEIIALKQVLYQSTPLIPELEKVYDVGRSSFNSALSYEECKEDYYDYISNLKLDI